MTVDGPIPRWRVPASRGAEDWRLPAVDGPSAHGKEADSRASGCVAAHRATVPGGQSSAAPTLQLAALLPTYSPSRVPFEFTVPRLLFPFGARQLSRC